MDVPNPEQFPIEMARGPRDPVIVSRIHQILDGTPVPSIQVSAHIEYYFGFWVGLDQFRGEAVCRNIDDGHRVTKQRVKLGSANFAVARLVAEPFPTRKTDPTLDVRGLIENDVPALRRRKLEEKKRLVRYRKSWLNRGRYRIQGSCLVKLQIDIFNSSCRLSSNKSLCPPKHLIHTLTWYVYS